MFRFKTNMEPVFRSFFIMLALSCLGSLACGCATLYIQPASVQQDELDFVVTVNKPHTSNGLAIIGFPPKTIGIICKKGGQFSKPVNMHLKGLQYKHTFYNMEEDIEYIIEPRTFVVFEVGLGYGPYKLSPPSPIFNVAASRPALKDTTLLPTLKAAESSPTVTATDYQNGYEHARKYRNRKLNDYRLVIELYPLSPSNRNKFLMGFQTAYLEANDNAQGEKYINILKQSISGGFYEQAFELGKKHANNQVTDAFIQTAIKRSLGLGGFELGWKAGYIEGFVQETEMKSGGDKKRLDKEKLYKEAETKYNAIRKSLGS